MTCFPSCDKSDLIKDSQGSMTCMACGRVADSVNIVSDLEFCNSKVVGYFYNIDRGMPGSYSARRYIRSDRMITSISL